MNLQKKISANKIVNMLMHIPCTAKNYIATHSIRSSQHTQMLVSLQDTWAQHF